MWDLVVVQMPGHVWLFAVVSMDCSMPGFPFLHYVLQRAQTYVHWVSDATQTGHPLLPPSAFYLSYLQGIFQGDLVGTFICWIWYSLCYAGVFSEWHGYIVLDLIWIKKLMSESCPWHYVIPKTHAKSMPAEIFFKRW